jgi:hypothetical protein
MSFMLDSIKLSLYAAMQDGDVCPVEEAYARPTTRATRLQNGTPDEITV